MNQLTKVIIEISTDLFSILGIFVYIEFIELRFCGLNYNSRKTIIRRSMEDMDNVIDNRYDDEDEEDKI